MFSYVDLDYFRIERKPQTNIILQEEDGLVTPITSETGSITEEQTDMLSNIIKVLNDNYGSDLSEDDRLDIERISAKLFRDEKLREIAGGDNTKTNKKYYYEKLFDQFLQDLVDDRIELYTKLSEPNRNKFIKEAMFNEYMKGL